ncbi:MAG TPA: YggS family pyridoxal phosphate-dependent enzyme [Mycobacteriales bacterium]|nr:YggS family pyridoxal phosphate-dependent enzyme [Mycobacteriales bacterium]
MTRRDELAANLARVEARLAAACAAAGRDRAEVTLIAITKTWPASDAALLRELGVTDLGENRDQEAAAKAREVTGVRWHFVGRVQTNKAAHVAGYAHVVHAVDRDSLVDALAAGARRAHRVVDVLVQVSIDSDPDRGGASPDRVPALADRVAAAKGLQLCGVMAVAPLAMPPATAFARLTELAAALRGRHPGATLVSAGMSGDLEEAVAAGATHVRVGTAILGPRPPLLG